MRCIVTAPSFPSGGKTFFQGEGFVLVRLLRACWNLGGINIYTGGRFDSKPKLTSAKFRGKLLPCYCAEFPMFGFYSSPRKFSFLEILFLSVLLRSVMRISILKRNNEFMKSMGKNDHKFVENWIRFRRLNYIYV